MTSAIYHTDTAPHARPLFVLKRHADGTVDLGTAAKVLVVGKCPVSAAPKVGHCVLVEVAASPARQPATAAKESKSKAGESDVAAGDPPPATAADPAPAA